MDSEEQEIAVTEEVEVGPSAADYSRGRWDGSDVTEAEIEWLYRSRHIPAGVACRIPKDELMPVPEPGEVIVFTAHFARGLGLPVSDFFRSFLDFYELQQHHLPANAVFILSSFAAFCEGYVGLWPSLKLWAQLYTLRINSIQDPTVPLPKPIVQCGACIVVPRQKSPHMKMAGLESCQKWQRTFFYVKNTGATDLINLPAYVAGEPSRVNWLYNPQQSHKETNRIFDYIVGLQEDHEPTADDIVRTFITRRVLPL